MSRFLFLFFVFYSCLADTEEATLSLMPSSQTGINFTNTLVESDSQNIIQYLYYYNGAGVGVADFNADGYTDILFSSNQSHPELYINNGDNSLSFVNMSESAGLSAISGWGTGVSTVDINGDGLMDVYLCQVGNYKSFRGRNRLLVNKGLNAQGVPFFEDETELYGLNFTGLSTHAAFLDYDLDGDLDMYLLNHSVHNTSNYGYGTLREVLDAEKGDRFYENKNGKFENVTSSTGIFSSKIGYGLGLVVSDFDNNGYPDVYIANDFHEHDYLYLNNKDKTFSEVIKSSSTHNSQFSMGVDAADINDDGWVDLISLDMRPEDNIILQSTVSHDANTIFNFKQALGYHYQYPHNQLQLNQGLVEEEYPVFSEIAQLVEMDATDWSWSVLIEDYNNDGIKDIFITNGIVRRPNDLDYLNYIANEEVQLSASDLDLVAKMPSGLSSNYLYLGSENLKFKKIQSSADYGMSNGAAYADFDNDGDLDIVTNNINENAFIYENNSDNNYTQIKLLSPNANTNAIGSKINVFIANKIITKYVTPYRGFMSSSDNLQTIGINKHTKIDSIQITWPDLKQQVIYSPSINTLLEIVKSENLQNEVLKNKNHSLLRKSTNFFFLHIEDTISRDVNNLNLQHYGAEGPSIAIGDINNDTSKDIFISNGSNETSILFAGIQPAETTFRDTLFKSVYGFDVTASTMFDYDGDGNIDLINSGSSSRNDLYMPNIEFNRNNGNGTFNMDKSLTIPLFFQQASCLLPADFDLDGDVDLFVGNRTGLNNLGGDTYVNYSRLLVNNSNGFIDFGNNDLLDLGNVTDAAWSDIDADGDSDLVVVSEWLPITLLINKENGFSKRIVNNSEGYWRTVEVTDIDNDGDEDIIAGNIGLNNQMRISTDEPLLLHLLEDLASGSNFIVSYGENTLVESTDDILKQIPAFKKTFISYKDFAMRELSEKFDNSIKTIGEIKTFETKIFLNDGLASFSEISLPVEVQYSSVNSIIVDDLNGDGNKDLILAGNEYSFSSSFGRKDGSYGLVLLQEGDLNFRALSAAESGLILKGMVRDAVKIQQGKYLFAINNADAVIYELTSEL